MADRVKSTDARIELSAHGVPMVVQHCTEAVFTDGLAEFVEIDGAPVAVVGSQGDNTAEHQRPKVGQTLVPFPCTCVVLSGDPLVTIEGRPVAHESSACRVPDVLAPRKSGVLEVRDAFVFVQGQGLLRGGS
ncbi:MAG: hypothetical protein IPM29_04530 [Planctomycetes bacterium]|nr:hypothetical protein [Planctomycetota bacterium]